MPTDSLKSASAAAVHAWLDHWTVEMVAAHEPGKINVTLERRRTWSQRRLLQAVQTVERIRGLTRPRGPRVAVVVNNLTTQAPALDIKQRTLELAG